MRYSKVRLQLGFGQTSDLKEQQYELPHPKMRGVLCQDVYKPSMIIQLIQHHSKCLNSWTFRVHFRTSWWMAYKILQMDCRTSLTSNGIAVLVVCVLETPSIWLRQIDALCKPMETSFSFNQGRYCWQGHGWACWTHFGLPQCMNRVCNNYKSTTSGVTFFFESWPCSALPLGSLPLVLPLKFLVRGTQHCHLHCRQVWNVFRIVVTCKYLQHFGHERIVNRNAVVMPINGSPSPSSNVFQAAKMDGFYDFLHPLHTCTKERLYKCLQYSQDLPLPRCISGSTLRTCIYSSSVMLGCGQWDMRGSGRRTRIWAVQGM